MELNFEFVAAAARRRTFKVSMRFYTICSEIFVQYSCRTLSRDAKMRANRKRAAKIYGMSLFQVAEDVSFVFFILRNTFFHLMPSHVPHRSKIWKIFSIRICFLLFLRRQNAESVNRERRGSIWINFAKEITVNAINFISRMLSTLKKTSFFPDTFSLPPIFGWCVQRSWDGLSSATRAPNRIDSRRTPHRRQSNTV